MRMAKEKSMTATTANASWFSEMFHVGMYKRSQGKIARQATFGALGLACALAAWRISVYLNLAAVEATYDWLLGMWPFTYISEGAAEQIYQVLKILSLEQSVPLVIVAVGLWLSYRIVNIPRFADFLIAVEAEMNKVSWPSKDELIRSSIVVIFVIFVMSTLLFGYDVLWKFVFEALGVLKKES